jgi:hypothetical protein
MSHWANRITGSAIRLSQTQYLILRTSPTKCVAALAVLQNTRYTEPQTAIQHTTSTTEHMYTKQHT